MRRALPALHLGRGELGEGGPLGDGVAALLGRRVLRAVHQRLAGAALAGATHPEPRAVDVVHLDVVAGASSANNKGSNWKHWYVILFFQVSNFGKNRLVLSPPG